MSWCIAVSDLKSPVAAAGAGTVLRHSASGKLRGRTPVNVDEQSDLICALRPVFADELPADHIGGYACGSYDSGGGATSRLPRIARDVTAGSALVSCVLVSNAPCVEKRRFCLLRRG